MAITSTVTVSLTVRHSVSAAKLFLESCQTNSATLQLAACGTVESTGSHS